MLAPPGGPPIGAPFGSAAEAAPPLAHPAPQPSSVVRLRQKLAESASLLQEADDPLWQEASLHLRRAQLRPLPGSLAAGGMPPPPHSNPLMPLYSGRPRALANYAASRSVPDLRFRSGPAAAPSSMRRSESPLLAAGQQVLHSEPASSRPSQERERAVLEDPEFGHLERALQSQMAHLESQLHRIRAHRDGNGEGATVRAGSEPAQSRGPLPHQAAGARERSMTPGTDRQVTVVIKQDDKSSVMEGFQSIIDALQRKEDSAAAPSTAASAQLPESVGSLLAKEVREAVHKAMEEHAVKARQQAPPQRPQGRSPPEAPRPPRPGAGAGQPVRPPPVSRASPSSVSPTPRSQRAPWPQERLTSGRRPGTGGSRATTTASQQASSRGRPPRPEAASDQDKNAKRQSAKDWNPSERMAYLESLGIADKRAERGLLRFLESALAAAPIPVPWTMFVDQAGHSFFYNEGSGESTWRHPLEQILKDLAATCRQALRLHAGKRNEWLQTLVNAWTEEAAKEYAKWYTAKDSNGREYYCQVETNETMWEHPVNVILPAYYVKIEFAKKLLDHSYVDSLLAVPPMAPSQPAVRGPHDVAFAETKASGSSQRGDSKYSTSSSQRAMAA